jgi:hypothetical protein
MTCALRGYSSIRSGEGKTLKQQHDVMFQFYHGVKDTKPSQILMLCQGVSPYSDLYKTITQQTVSKKSPNKKKKSPTIKTCLKESLSRDESRVYYTGTDITKSDLEKKNRNGSNTILNGRQITDMAKRGLRDYRKALSFTTDKWDLKKKQPIESGTTVEDIIEYVRRKMYLSDNKVITINDDEEDEKNDMLEWELMKKLLNKEKEGKDNDESSLSAKDSTNATDSAIENVKTKGKATEKAKGKTKGKVTPPRNAKAKGKGSAKKDETVDSNEDGDNTDSDVSDTSTSKSRKNKNDDGGDEDYDDDENEDDEESDSNEDGTYDEDDEDYVPPDYIFNSYFAYCLWGPFATEEKQLPLFLLGKLYTLKTDGDILIIAYTNTIHLF